MAENLKEVIERLKLQNSQKSKPIEVVKEKEVEQDDEEFFNQDDDEEEQQNVQETPKAKERTVESKVNSKNTENTKNTESSNLEIDQQQVVDQINSLQNNGIYRYEMLAQLDEIKKALVIIASMLADLTGAKHGK